MFVRLGFDQTNDGECDGDADSYCFYAKHHQLAVGDCFDDRDVDQVGRQFRTFHGRPLYDYPDSVNVEDH